MNIWSDNRVVVAPRRLSVQAESVLRCVEWMQEASAAQLEQFAADVSDCNTIDLTLPLMLILPLMLTLPLMLMLPLMLILPLMLTLSLMLLPGTHAAQLGCVCAGVGCTRTG